MTFVVIFFRPTGRLDEYLACIAKIQKAVEYFQDNNPDSPELNTVVQFNSHNLDCWIAASLVNLAAGLTYFASAIFNFTLFAMLQFAF